MHIRRTRRNYWVLILLGASVCIAILAQYKCLDYFRDWFNRQEQIKIEQVVEPAKADSTRVVVGRRR